MTKDISPVLVPVVASPEAWAFDPQRTALLIIDMQRDFIEPGGFGAALGNDVSQLGEIVPAVARLLALARRNGWLVVHTRESHLPDLSDCPPAKRLRGRPQARIGDRGPMGRILVRGEPGNAIIDAVAPVPGEIVIDKPGKGAFYATVLDAELRARGVTHLIFAGVTTEVCVQTSMREANDRGYSCLLVEDATASYFPAFKAATLDMMRAQGAIVGWTAALAALEQACGQGASALLCACPEAAGTPLALNLPDVLAEVGSLFAAYEQALIDNDVAAMDALFWEAPQTVRYGIAEVLHGSEAIRAWRAQATPVPVSRRLHRTVITTFGRDHATVSTEFTSDETDLLGRQMQTWARIAPAGDADPTAGWRIVAAHVSLI